MAKKNYYGNFNPSAAAKALKGADRIFCQIADDGAIYVTSGCFLFKLAPADYAAIVQPVTHCDAGNWTIDRSGKRDGGMNIAAVFAKSVKGTEHKTALRRCPLHFQPDAKAARDLVGFYNAEDDFAAFYNAAYIAATGAGATIKAPGATGPAIVYHGDEAAALIMPICPDAKASRAVKAYFTEADDELLQAQNEISALRGQLARQADELTALRDSLQAAHSTPEDNKPEPKTAAGLIAARWAEVDGLTATIKGARTAAPVVWLAGDVQKHANAIEAEGGKWSNKKSAYYFRVA